jgi:hypothetical protein
MHSLVATCVILRSLECNKIFFPRTCHTKEGEQYHQLSFLKKNILNLNGLYFRNKMTIFPPLSVVVILLLLLSSNATTKYSYFNTLSSLTQSNSGWPEVPIRIYYWRFLFPLPHLIMYGPITLMLGSFLPSFLEPGSMKMHLTSHMMTSSGGVWGSKSLLF